MLNTYDSLYINDGDRLVPQTDRTNMFIPYSNINDDGTFHSILWGDGAVIKDQGFTFIVDSWVPEQHEKLKIDNSGFIPKLVVIEGETIEDPRTEDQKRIQSMEQELIELKAQQSAMTP